MEKLRGFEIAKGFENAGINLPVRKTKCSAGAVESRPKIHRLPSAFRR